jgi:hypothetical protein
MTDRKPITVGGHQFLPDKYGWFCASLRANIQRCAGSSGAWKVFRENHDAISPTEAKLWGSPHPFATPEEAATAAVTIWGRP